MIGTMEWSVVQEGPWSVPGLRTSSSLCLTKACGSWVWIMQNQKAYGSRMIKVWTCLLDPWYFGLYLHGCVWTWLFVATFWDHGGDCNSTLGDRAQIIHGKCVPNRPILVESPATLTHFFVTSSHLACPAINRCSQSSHRDMDRIHDLLDKDLSARRNCNVGRCSVILLLFGDISATWRYVYIYIYAWIIYNKIWGLNSKLLYTWELYVVCSQ